MLNRRSFIRSGVLGSSALWLSRTLSAASQYDSASSSDPLRLIAQRRNRYIGAQATKGQLTTGGLGQFVASNFNMLTAGLELKWSALRPTPSSYDFVKADWMVEFAEKNSMRFHGHNLCWNVSNPKWFGSELNSSNARQTLEDHIHQVVKRYAGRVDSWDVVNEPFDLRSSRPDGLHTGPWLDFLGPEYVEIAFHAAAASDPEAIRVLNIYQVEQDQSRSDFVRQTTIAHLTDWLKRGVPVQAVGLQSHIGTSLPVASAGRDRFIRQVRDLGLEVMLTELDVNDNSLIGSSANRDQVVASYYRDYLSDVIPLGDIKRIICWTVSDKFNWIDAAGKSSNQQPHRPGLLDETMSPKAAYRAVASALER